MDIGKFELVDKTSQYLVFGYIRNIQIKLLPKNITFYIIPPYIKRICAIFYFISAHWDINLTSANLKITNQNIKHIGHSSWSNAFLSPIIYNYIHYWTFKLVNKAGGLLFGIWINTDNDPKLNLDKLITKKANTSYAFYSHRRMLNIHDQDRKWTKDGSYGIRCKTGDIITMCLDCNSNELSFIINGNNCYKAFTVKSNVEYRAVISSYLTGNEIELLKYETKYK